MVKFFETKIIHVGTTYDKENFTTVEQYTYNFSLIGKLNEDNGITFDGINVHDEVVQLIKEQFYWDLIKFAYNLDMDKIEDEYFFMQKICPESIKDMTLEEYKKLNISDLK